MSLLKTKAEDLLGDLIVKNTTSDKDIVADPDRSKPDDSSDIPAVDPDIAGGNATPVYEVNFNEEFLDYAPVLKLLSDATGVRLTEIASTIEGVVMTSILENNPVVDWKNVSLPFKSGDQSIIKLVTQEIVNQVMEGYEVSIVDLTNDDVSVIDDAMKALNLWDSSKVRKDKPVKDMNGIIVPFVLLEDKGQFNLTKESILKLSRIKRLSSLVVTKNNVIVKFNG